MRLLAPLLAFSFAFCLSIGSASAQGADSLLHTAASFSLGGGCGAPAPILNAGNPFLGETLLINGTGPQGALGLLFLSLPIGGFPMNIGGPTFTDPCVLFIQANAYVILDAFVVPSNGQWISCGDVPSDPAAEFAALNLQAGFLNTATGITASNGVRLILGE